MEAKVIKIISDKQIVLNVGLNKGIVEGDLFRIIDSGGEEITDPETGESYGRLEIPKATVKVLTVLPKMCICVNNDEYLQLTSTIQPITPSLRVNLNQVSGGYSTKTLPIQLCDIAYKIK